MDLYEFLVDSELQHYYNSIKYVSNYPHSHAHIRLTPP